MPLVAHLCNNVRIFPRFLHKQFGFYEGARHRFLEIYVLSVIERHHSYGKVHVVGHSGHHCLELVAVFLEHFAEVAEAFSIRVFCKHFLRLFAVEVHVAKRNYVYHTRAGKFVNILFPSVAYAYESYLNLVAFRRGNII